MVSRQGSTPFSPESSSASLIRRVKEEAARSALETEKEALLAQAWELEKDPLPEVVTATSVEAEEEVEAAPRKRTLEELKALVGDLWDSDDLTKVLNDAYRAQ